MQLRELVRGNRVVDDADGDAAHPPHVAAQDGVRVVPRSSWPSGRPWRHVLEAAKLQLWLCETVGIARAVVADEDTSDSAAPIPRRFMNALVAVAANIAEVLALTVEQARELFSAHPRIARRLDTIIAVGLGYVTLGQPATTLSGGEAQRIKLSREFAKRATGSTLYILDEPTTGSHFDDVRKLLAVLHTLADRGNTGVVIEHHLDAIETADHVIDLGPEGGDGGGLVIAQGTPEEVAQVPESFTGQYLKRVLGA